MPDFPFQKKEKKDVNLRLESAENLEKEEKKAEKIIGISKKEIEKEREKEKDYEKVAEQPTTATPPKISLPQTESQVAPVKIEKSATLLEIEQILSENLDQLYTSLTPEQKVIFKQSGEKAALEVETLLKEFKINVNKILDIIKNWLLLMVKMIPGVNKIFLIKEAKIKTDKILLLREKEINKK